MSSSISHSISLNLRERSDTNHLPPTNIYICISTLQIFLILMKIKMPKHYSWGFACRPSEQCLTLPLLTALKRHYMKEKIYRYVLGDQLTLKNVKNFHLGIKSAILVYFSPRSQISRIFATNRIIINHYTGWSIIRAPCSSINNFAIFWSWRPEILYT